ncbi:MAG: glutamate formimidoyltransferase [Caldithrix sp.]|nr:glutamate formimidoyltransferase [Caldithrix sp.]
MHEPLVECVPNFSEGQNSDVIKQITDTIESVDGIKLLDVDPGKEMNRTVVTFVGPPAAVKTAAFKAIEKASQLIDMSKHSGSHPRMGATDVCPFVPVQGITVEECIELSKEVAGKVAQELNIPVYLYEKSAQSPQRENLAIIRKGEYEALPTKLKDPQWKPDYGPTEFNARSGATVIGVREFLIAYNISLNTREAKYATDIAFELREKGRSARRGNTNPFYFKGTEILKYKENHYPCGDCDFVGKTMKETIDHCQQEHGYELANLLSLQGIDPQKPEGQSVKKPGKFKECKAIGWMVPEYDRAQISINLTNYKVTNMHDVLEKTRRLAADRGIVVTGSEIVGMVPFQALMQSGNFYLHRQVRSAGIPIKDVLQTAVQSLGINDVSPFNIKERVIGLPDNTNHPLIDMKVDAFVDEVSRESPAPGGGSIAALSGSLGAALSSMVSNLTANKRGSEEVDEVLNQAAEKAQGLKFNLLRAVDADTDAFNAYMEARRLPDKTTDQKEKKQHALQEGLKSAVQVPYNTALMSLDAIKIAETVVEYGNPNSITDVGVGAQMAFAGVMGGIYNVLINLGDIEDPHFVTDMKQKCNELEQEAAGLVQKISKKVEKRIQ